MKTILLAVVVILACGVAVLYSRSDDVPAARPAPAVAAVTPPAAYQPVVHDAPAAGEATDSEAPDKPDLQAQFDQALDAHEVAIERFLIVGRAINSERLALLAADDNYDRYVVRMQSEASQRATNDTAAFQQYLLDQKAVASGAVDVSDVVCGATLCTATVSGADKERIVAYYSSLAQATGGNAPPRAIYSMLYVPFQTPTGFGMRLVFSIDSLVNGASVPAPGTGSSSGS